ncbi:hypothetical protein [Sporisorium scitamineum]|uniref:Uncharacterized protein n=1 Tax=Sporisorium scitamineum TaxID=49012 RepID=A0A0F7S8J8_9BASI|nr:hypothetical protein [Sporisorium scitamineum]
MKDFDSDTHQFKTQIGRLSKMFCVGSSVLNAVAEIFQNRVACSEQRHELA